MARIVNVLNGMDDVPGATITRYCASSVQTTRMAFHAIKAGEGDVFISAGVETVSRFAKGSSDSLARHPQPALRRRHGAHRPTAPSTAPAARPGTTRARTASLPDAYIAMGQTAENVATAARPDPRRSSTSSASARRTSPRRRIADGFWAARDHAGHHARRHRGLAPTTARAPASPSRRSRELKPVFRPDGVVTAGNCCPLNDGAAAVVIMSDTKAAELGLTPLARIVVHRRQRRSPPRSWGSARSRRPGGRSPTPGMTIGDIDLVEINEAFAAQVVPSYQDLGIDLDRLNVNGGAIAVGHPFGMTGARLQNTMLNSLDWHDKSTGLITMCVGGGQGMALILERL